MKISTISELIKADDGFVPEAIKATVDKVYEVREGEGKNGAWKLQPGVIREGEETMRVVFSGRQTYDNVMLEGTEIYSRSSRKKDGTLMGMKVSDNEYNGKVTKELFIYKFADVSFGDEDSGTAIVDFVQEAKPVKKSPAAKPVEDTAGTSAEEEVEVHLNEEEQESVLTAKKAVTKSSNLMLICMDAARWTAGKYEKKHGTPVTPEQFQAICSTLFINADKRGLVATMPNKPIS